MKRTEIRLKAKEREELEDIRSKGKHNSHEIQHANILLLSDDGKKPKELIGLIGTSYATIYNVKQRYLKEGLHAAIKERPKKGKPRKFDREKEDKVVEIARSEAPEGHLRWTLSLIADRLVELKVVDSVARETVRGVLKKTKSSHG